MIDWNQCVARGDFAAAWEINDAVLRSRVGVPCWHLPRHEQWVWDGRSLHGRRVLIRCYHGLGDTIQFIRYAALVRKVARAVIVWVQPPLLALVGRVEGVDRALPLHDGQPDACFDVDVEIMELPHIFRSTLADLPALVPYLHTEPEPPRTAWDPSRCHVGVVWQAGDWDHQRSVPLPLLAHLGQVPGVVLHALQRGRALSEWHRESGPISGSDDATATAQVMRALDLIVTVDSFPAHLAGALGRPVWTLLHSAPDWRWMAERNDSPWYPTMRLFRQKNPRQWEPVIEEVVSELTVFARRTSSSP